MNSLRFSNIRLDAIKNLYHQERIVMEVLRLDLIHPQVSGNKWFKLKEYLSDAVLHNKQILLTFGGAYSNHIAATAAAGREAGLLTIGIIRGEAPPSLSHTLQQARADGMELFFVAREVYKAKQVPQEVWEKYPQSDVYVIGEGGYGLKGREGAQSILACCDRALYSHIIAACGTGTTLAGLVAAALPQQQVVGIPVLKNLGSLGEEINALLPLALHSRFTLMPDYHFGGYARQTPQLLGFMNQWYQSTAIPSDFVYTGKLFFAVDDLIRNGFFPPGSRLLVIHSGGLQGNLSLPKGTLIFQ
jgi:1-aminocyclopropane-1-carboxylate deaminase